MSLPFAATAEGVTLSVRLTPRGGADRVEGVTAAGGQPCLAVRVAAAPVDGAANRALVRLLSDLLDVPKGAVRLVSGETARVKRLAVSGDPAALAARLAVLSRG